MHQFGWLSERGGNILNLLQGGYPERGGGPTLEETMLKKVMLQFVALIAPDLIYLFPLVFTFSVFRQEVKLEKNQIIYCYT